MDKDIQDIKIALAEMKSDLMALNKQLAEMCRQCQRHTETIYGNSHPGLVQRTSNLETRFDIDIAWSKVWRGAVVTIALFLIGVAVAVGEYKRQVNVNTGRITTLENKESQWNRS